MDAPEWLTPSYLQEALRLHHKDPKLQLHSMHVQPATGKGENYGGVLTRIKAQYRLSQNQQRVERSFIAKTSFEADPIASTIIAPYDIFNREMRIYEEVLPKLNDLLSEIDDPDQLFAKAIHVDYKRQLLIFEDLSARGYVIANRLHGLDMAHIKLILDKLAKMHATSAVLNERENGCLEIYDRGFFNRYTDNYSPYFVGTLIACSEFILKNMPESSYYGHKLKALAPHYMEIGKRCFSPTQGEVNVLAHGDVWVNNVMFKYDPKTSEPVDVLIIDFQYSFWGSPTIDLHHLFNTSLQEPLRLNKQDILFQYYHNIFSDILKRLNYRTHPVPTLKKFLQRVEQKRFFAFHSSCVIQPVMICEDTDDADFNTLMGEDERALKFKYNIYQNAQVQKNLKNLLPIFDNRGLLEINQIKAFTVRPLRHLHITDTMEPESSPVTVWLNEEYVQKVFRKYKRDEGLKVLQLDLKPATAKGDNYVSILTRIKVKYQLSNNKTESGSYIVKSSLDDGSFAAQIIQGYELCSTEMLMYGKILPKLSAMLKESGDYQKIFAETVHVDYEHSAILLEDLTAQGFVCRDRITGINELEVKLTLKNLAKMHAAGAVLNERMPGVLDKLNMGFFNRSTSGLAPYYEGLFEVCANFSGECETLGSYYKNKLLQLKPHVVEHCTRVFEPPQSYFQTLLHGDLWINNTLMRDSEGGELKDIVLIDFQFSCWSTPAVDLHYYFNTSLSNELRIDRQDELVKYYHDNLAETLLKLKYDGRIPTLHDICVQMEAGRFYAMSSTVVNQSVMLNEDTDDAEFESLVGSDERSCNFRRSCYTNKRVQDNIKTLLPYFDRKGLLDIYK
ncbi:uncharacterized protein [Eurosta solidaginis]|uniref:uncharacterized protein n=1 Tax=Eurosta solidaginis TaxID=178769 RepID=UPI00353162AF